MTDSSSAAATSAPRGVNRAAAVPVRSAEFEHLSLQGLRGYRSTLSVEEHRVSYWRRLIQAKIDVTRSIETGTNPSVATLSQVFAESRPATGRAAFADVGPSDDLPPLPDLLRLWHLDARLGDSVYNATLLRELGKAESQLSAYRLALHRRLSAATGELIARYRDDPSQCLSALPLQPPLGKHRHAAAH